MAAGIAGSRTARYRQRPIAGTMEVAGRDAALQIIGKRLVGDSYGFADEKRTARVLLCVYRDYLIALHGFIKKTRKTPDEDLDIARKRKKELEQ
jgi:hypothetical protein